MNEQDDCAMKITRGKKGYRCGDRRTETPIPDLEFWHASTGKQLSYTAVPSGGKGYVRYDFEIPPTACFSLESASHHFKTKDFCVGNGPAFVTQTSDLSN